MDPFYLDNEPAGSRPWLKGTIVAIVSIALLAGGALLLRAFLGHPSDKGPGLHSIALINQPPPPPKPPEKPPEPPKPKEEVKVDEPKSPPKADDPKPADKPSSDKPLGVDADGTAGSDGFGLAGNKGGQDLAGSGNGGGGAYYSGLLQRQFFEALSRNRKVLRDEFRVVVKIWLADDGRVTRADIVSGSGNAQVDEQIQVTLMDMQPLRDVPPGSMRPIQLRLSNRS